MSVGNNRVSRVLNDLLLDDDVQEALDGQCASDDFMSICTEREERAFRIKSRKVESSLQKQLDTDVRKRAITFTWRLIAGSLHEESWSDSVVVLFDAYCCRATSPVQVEDVPALCVVLPMLLQKADNADIGARSSVLWQRLVFSLCANQFKQSLREAGHEVSTSIVTEKTVSDQEVLFLKELSWQINLPTVESWMSSYCARMNTLTRRAMIQTLVSVWQQSLQIARAFLFRRAGCPDLPPQRVARGLLALGCAAARLLPPESLGIDEDHDLETLFTQLPPAGSLPAQSKVRQQFFEELLKVATCSSLKTLREDCNVMWTVLQTTDMGS